MIDRITTLIRERCQGLADELELIRGTQLSQYRCDRKTAIANLLKHLRDFYRHRSRAFDDDLINVIQQSNQLSLDESQVVDISDGEFKDGGWYLVGKRMFKVLKTNPYFEIEDQGAKASFTTDYIDGFWDRHVLALQKVNNALSQYQTQQFSAQNEILQITESFRSTLRRIHADFLLEHGLDNCDLRMSQGRQRHAHCYSCKEELDNSMDLECSNCGWIVCICGACGCGYSKEWDYDP